MVYGAPLADTSENSEIAAVLRDLEIVDTEFTMEELQGS